MKNVYIPALYLRIIALSRSTYLVRYAESFDRIEHNYLYRVLDKFSFGPVFQTWMKVLYMSPQASVRTNGILSEYFPIGRGTRQGCPLSPLFDIAI